MIEKFFSSQLRINMVSGVAATVVNVLVLAIAYPVYLHFLSYEKYGVWLVLATVLSFAQLGNLGIGQAIMKLVAEEHGRGDIESIQRYVATALTLLCLSGAVALVVILAFKNQIIAAFNLSNENARTVSWLLPYIGILSIYVFVVQALNATLSGLGRMDLANYTQSAGRIVAVATAGSLLYRGYGIESLLVGNALSYVSIHIISLICIWRIARLHIMRTSNFDRKRCKRLLRFGGGVFGGSLISMLFDPFNKLMLSRYAGVSTIPVYEIAFKGSMQVRSLIEAGLRALMPEISRIGADMTSYAKDRISQIYHRAVKFDLLFGIPIYGILVIFAPLLLRVWLGERFVASLPGVLRIMLVGTFLSLMCVPAYYTLMGMGRIRYCLASHVIQGTVNMGVVVTIVLVSGRVSVYSIAWSLLVAMAVTSIYVSLKKHQTMKSLSWE